MVAKKYVIYILKESIWKQFDFGLIRMWSRNEFIFRKSQK